MLPLSTVLLFLVCWGPQLSCRIHHRQSWASRTESCENNALPSGLSFLRPGSLQCHRLDAVILQS